MQSNDTGKLILRLTIGILILFHGVSKLAGVGFIENMLQSKGLPGFFAYAVYIGEIVAPLMLIVGFRSRIAGLLVALNMLVAIGLVHLGEIFALTDHGAWALELQGMFLFGAVAIMFLGGGRFAVSNRSSWD